MKSLPPEPPGAAATDACRELMSSLADGRGDVQSCVKEWNDNPRARRAWYEYHLIGDILRSDDLARGSLRDEAFLGAVRDRLAAEPAIVAPAAGVGAAQAGGRSSRRWAMAAAAAGVMMVGGVAVVLRQTEGSAVAPLAAAGAGVTLAASKGLPRAASAPLGDPRWQVVDGQEIRDARLDAYLRAHRGLAAARPGAVPGRFESVVLER